MKNRPVKEEFQVRRICLSKRMWNQLEEMRTKRGDPGISATIRALLLENPKIYPLTPPRNKEETEHHRKRI